MNVAPIRRRMKNVVRNYSEAQRKVREATSNDPWGPSSSLMSEIADLTYNVVAFSEIMQMIWKRLNDHGKNWRHVYKALVLLEYIIKTGTEKVAQQCKENIFAIQTLKDFQYIEENKDQGMNVREKAKQLVALLKDDERLKNERARALKAKERFAQTATGIGSNSSQYGGVSGGSPQPEYQSGYSDSHVKEDQEGAVEAELECARPQTAGEEELQLQLALAMSKEEAEQEERIRRGDDVRLQLALTESQEDFRKQQEHLQHNPGGAALLDILDGSAAVSYNSAPLTDPWGVPLTSNQPSHPEGWGSPSTARSTPALSTDPWGTRISRSNTPSSAGTTPTRAVVASSRPATQSVSQTDPWGASIAKSAAPAVDPWGAPLRTSPPLNTQQNASGFDTFSTQSNGDLDDFDLISSRNTASSTNNGFDLLEGSSSSQSPFDFGNMTQTLSNNQAAKRKTPETFLGENSSLVNLDALVTKSTSQASTGSTNPFAAVGASNPFQNSRQSVPMNRMRSPTMGYQVSSDVLPTPLLPTASSIRSQTPSNNPFL